MSLSNIRNNPRKEIKETLVGVVAIGLFATVAWAIGTFVLPLILSLAPPDHQTTRDVVDSGLLGVLATLLLLFFILGTHLLGEIICDAWDL